MRPHPATGPADLGLSGSALHTFAAALQGVVAARVSAEVTSSAPSALTGKVATLSLLQLHFTCGVAVDGDLPPIWEAVARGKGRMEELLSSLLDASYYASYEYSFLTYFFGSAT